MKKHTQGRKICDSWYHQKWFRILLVIVGFDMVILGVAVVLNLDVFSLIQGLHSILRIIGGIAYILVASFVVHYALSYKKLREETYLVCQHCAHTEKEDK